MFVTVVSSSSLISIAQPVFYGILGVYCRCFSLFICVPLVILLVPSPYSVSIFDYFPLLPDVFVEPWFFWFMDLFYGLLWCHCIKHFQQFSVELIVFLI